ncbi:MAG: NTP transferase domain-containing protein [Thermoanaerobaculia bacterium]|nr:NTP transferase domain-containing protein [Thermoanaerobaculia bacterium]
MIAFVLAAGFGTRFRPETLTRPKSLLPLGGRPILFHVFDHLLGEGADAFVVNAHHLAEELRGAVGESYAGVPVAWSVEEEILGTAGGIRRAQERGLLGSGAFLVANGDVLTTFPLGRLLAGRHEPGVVSALAVVPNGAPSVETPLWADAKGRLAAVGGERPREDATGPWLFTGLQAATPALAARIPAGFSELARDVLGPSARSRDGAFALVPYRMPDDGLFFDLGTRDRLAAAEAARASRAALAAPAARASSD